MSKMVRKRGLNFRPYSSEECTIMMQKVSTVMLPLMLHVDWFDLLRGTSIILFKKNFLNIT